MRHDLRIEITQALSRSILATAAACVAGCASQEPLVRGPLAVRPVAPLSYLEPAPTGAIYRASLGNVALFSDQRRPQAIGDTLKINIAESLVASSTVSSNTSRANAVASKGPGTSSDQVGGLIKGLANMNASASGSDSFTGKGDSQNSSKFTGQLAAFVVNVLPNGHLVVAGERSLSFNGGASTLRFSGVVNPADIQAGGFVASTDVVDARLELVGKGDVSDATGRNWLQRLLTQGLSVW